MRVPTTQVQNNFGRYLKYVQVHEEIIITKKGKDVAKLVPCEEPDSIMEGAAEYQTHEGRITYEEFLELTENSEQRFELIDGVVYNMTSPTYGHQHAVNELHGTFYNWFKGKKCTPLTSPFDVTFFKSKDNICVVQPDVIVICDRDKTDKNGKYNGIPSLVAEVLSPSSRNKDMLKKLDLYMQCGVAEYWIIDLKNEQVLVYSFEEKDIAEFITYRRSGNIKYAESIIFKGLKVSLDELFINIK